MSNGHQRITAALRGEQPDRTPVMLHNFMMASDEAGITMRQFRSDPSAVARSFIEAVEKYGYDGVMLDIDTVTLAGAVGVPLDLPDDLPGRSHGPRLGSLGAADTLEPIDIRRDPRVQVWLEAAALLTKHFGDEVFVRGNCDQCPFSLAAAMRGLDGWLVDLTDPDNEERIHALLKFCTDIALSFFA